MIIEVIQCPDCGVKALSFDDQRVTGPNCKRWNTIISFQVATEKIKQLAEERLMKDEKNKKPLCSCGNDADPAVPEGICVACGLPYKE